MREQLSEMVQKFAYSDSEISRGESLGNFLLAPACPIEK